jgi:ABC-2 type transport system permease protein
MNKIRIIARREFLVRVRKKSFRMMTLLGPFLFAAILIVPIWIKTSENPAGEIVDVVDETGAFASLQGGEHLFFHYHDASIGSAKLQYLQGNSLGLLYIPASAVEQPSEITFFSKKRLPYRIRQSVEQMLRNSLHDFKIKKVLKELQIDLPDDTFNIRLESITDSYDEETGSAAAAVGLFLAILIYFFILLYGLQVMRSIMEEKSSRVVEVLIASIHPFELMLGKILGVAMVSLLQFFLWMTTTGALALFLKWRFGRSIQLFRDERIGHTLTQGADIKQALEMNEFIHAFEGMEPVTLLVSFFIFFICGYLLYSSLFAAIGAIVDSETDLQQFMLPVTLPLLLSFMLISVIMEHPHGSLAYWLSLFPLTSPVVMMVRLPYGVPVTELLTSLGVLVVSFFMSTWCAAKIYKTGILLYGKKISYVEIVRWLFSKE